jgi:Spy/CpxP family protein refolding chaperone
MKEGVKTLSEQVEKKADDAALKATLADLRSSRKAMAEATDRFHDSLASFLTPTQQAKLALGMAERMRGARGGRGPGMGDRRQRGASAPKEPPAGGNDDGE